MYTTAVQSSELRRLMVDDHIELEGLFFAAVAAARADDREALAAVWQRFEKRLSGHMAAEEDLLLPLLAAVDVAEAQRIRDEHGHIRADLDELGLELELHLLRAERVEQFIARLRAHARHEERALYAWAERALPAPLASELRARLA